jgi:predicted permease
MGTVLQDARYALRSLRRSPAFTVVALLTIALGVGANAAMFSVVNGVLLRPLPYAEPDRLMRLHQASPEHGLERARASIPDFEDWRDRAASFASMAAYFSGSETLTGDGEPIEIASAFVTEAFFETLATPVQLGRPVLPADVAEARGSAVISDRLWRMRYGSDPGILGRPLHLAHGSYEIVGVARSDFHFPAVETDIWAPYTLLSDEMVGVRTRENRHVEVVGRLASGVTPERAHHELAAIAARLELEHPGTNGGWGAGTAVPLRTEIVGNVDGALLVVLGVVGFILLIGCANLANLLLARGSARSREIAVRTALGAGRGRLVRQLLTESMVLALLGGALGLLLAVGAVQAVLALSGDILPRAHDVRVDLRVVGFAGLIAAVTGLLFGILPALRAGSSDPQTELRGGRGTVGSSGQGLRATLVVVEVSLAVVLVIGAGLMARSFLELRGVDPGFEAAGVLTVSLQHNLTGIPEEEIVGHLIRRRDEIAEHLAALPGVLGAGATNAFPLRDGGTTVEFTRAGSDTAAGARPRVEGIYVSPDYFRAMGIPLRRGEIFEDRVAPGAPVPMLLSEIAAQRYWPGEDPLGRTIDMGWADAVVVGIVGDVRQAGLAEAPPPTAYFPHTVAPRLHTTLAVRTAGDPRALVGPVRQAIRELDPNQPIRAIQPLTGVLSESIARDRFFTLLFGVFGGLAFLLAAIGIYGVLAYSVGQRTQEIGVRMALGARTSDVVAMVVKGGLSLVLAGICIGTVVALGLTRLLQGMLFGISPTDPLTFLGVGTLLVLVGALASYLPARRATRVDPLVALRAD